MGGGAHQPGPGRPAVRVAAVRAGRAGGEQGGAAPQPRIPHRALGGGAPARGFVAATRAARLQDAQAAGERVGAAMPGVGASRRPPGGRLQAAVGAGRRRRPVRRQADRLRHREESPGRERQARFRAGGAVAALGRRRRLVPRQRHGLRRRTRQDLRVQLLPG